MDFERWVGREGWEMKKRMNVRMSRGIGFERRMVFEGVCFFVSEVYWLGKDRVVFEIVW